MAHVARITSIPRFGASVAPQPLPPLPVDPQTLVGKVIATVLAYAANDRSLPDPEGSPFGAGPSCTYRLTTESLQVLPVGTTWGDALYAARIRAAGSHTEQAVFQARNGVFFIGNVRMLPRGYAMWLMESPAAAVTSSLDYEPATSVLRAIVGPNLDVEFGTPLPPTTTPTTPPSTAPKLSAAGNPGVANPLPPAPHVPGEPKGHALLRLRRRAAHVAHAHPHAHATR